MVEITVDEFPNSAPNKDQIRNYLFNLKNKIYGSATLTIGELEEWCEQRSELTDDMDKVFVTYNIVADSAKNTEFYVFATTKRLISLCKKTKHICTDTTYKLIYQGYPVFLVGTTDQSKYFHPFGFAICSIETHEAFRFIFQSVKDCNKTMFNYEYNPNYLLADAADAITNGFKEVFGNNFKRAMCWAHASIKIDEHLLNTGDIKNLIKDDVRILQSCQSIEIFDRAYELFKIKWRSKNEEEINKFLSYFESQWINTQKGWFEGFGRGLPSTSNAI